MLFYLAPAIQTRMLVTFDESLNPLPVTVRVGQVSLLPTTDCSYNTLELLVKPGS